MGKAKITVGAIIGAIAGIAAGVLTAPKSGKETRSDIKEKAQAKRQKMPKLKLTNLSMQQRRKSTKLKVDSTSRRWTTSLWRTPERFFIV